METSGDGWEGIGIGEHYRKLSVFLVMFVKLQVGMTIKVTLFLYLLYV